MNTATAPSASAPTSEAHRLEFDLIFEEVRVRLQKKASELCRRERSPLFATGDLVNDVYLRLQRHPTYSLAIAARSRLEFMCVATKAMRRVLTDAARSAGPPRLGCVTLSAAEGQTPVTLSWEQILDLDRVLAALETTHPRQAAMVSMRFYGGFSVRELQELWGVSDATVERDLKLSFKFMHAFLSGPARNSDGTF